MAVRCLKLYHLTIRYRSIIISANHNGNRIETLKFLLRLDVKAMIDCFIELIIKYDTILFVLLHGQALGQK